MDFPTLLLTVTIAVLALVVLVLVLYLLGIIVALYRRTSYHNQWCSWATERRTGISR